MDLNQIIEFLFRTPQGVGVLVLVVIVICIIACVIMEIRTRKRFVDRKKKADDEDEWSLFDDEDENADDETASK